MSNELKKSLTLEPHWKAFFLYYALSVLLIPVIGIGLIGLWLTRRKQKSVYYVITDDTISAHTHEYVQNLDIVNIESIIVRQKGLQHRFNVGNLLIKTPEREMVMVGIQNPEKMKDTFDTAVAAAKAKLREKEKTKPRPQPKNPGEMERINYLTGLWQQGLISDEDFEAEKNGGDV